MPRRSECSQLDVEAGNFYAVLIFRPGEPHSLAWLYALFLSATDASPDDDSSFAGTYWTLTQAQPDTKWQFTCSSNLCGFGIPHDAAVFMKLGSVTSIGTPEDVEDLVTEIMSGVTGEDKKYWNTFDCREWLMAAVAQLSEYGYLACDEPIEFEQEVIAVTRDAQRYFKKEKEKTYAVVVADFCN